MRAHDFSEGAGWLGQEALRHRHAMRFRSLNMCERETFTLSTGWNHDNQSAGLERVTLQNGEVTVCPLPRKR